MKTRIGNSGQIGPMSLEDIFPMTVVIIIVFVFIALVFNALGGHLERRGTESTQKMAIELSRILCSRSDLIYSGKAGLLDSRKLTSTTYGDLSAAYNVTGYGFSIEIEDLRTGAKWTYRPADIKENTASKASPVAIRYSADSIHEGLMKVAVWRR